MASYRISIPESIIRFIAREIADWRENADELGLDLADVFQFNTTLLKKLNEIDSGNTLPNNPKSNNGNLKQSVKDKLDSNQSSSEFAGMTSDEIMKKLAAEFAPSADDL